MSVCGWWEGGRSYFRKLMESSCCGPVHLQVLGGEVGHEGRHSSSLPEESSVALQLAAVADGLGQLGAQLVVAGVGQLGQLVDHAVVRDDGQVLLVPGDVGDSKADSSQDLLVPGLQEVADQLQPSHKGADHVSRVLSISDAGREGPGSGSLAGTTQIVMKASNKDRGFHYSSLLCKHYMKSLQQ